MTKKFAFGVAVVALAALVMAPAASAACGSQRTASTYNPSTRSFNYWHAPSGDTTGTLVGNIWQAGAPGAYDMNSGVTPCTGTNFPLYFGSGGIGLNFHMEQCGQGCPAPNSTLATLAQKQDPTGVVDFLVATVAETAAGAINFDYSTQGEHQMLRLPQPTVLASGPKVGNTLPVHVSLASVSGGFYGPNAAATLTGYQIVYKLAAASPGTDASLFTPAPGGTVAAPGGVAVGDTLLQLDCTDPTNTKDAWIATQLSFEGGAILSPAVSQPKRVHCVGSLAEPKYKTVPRKISGPAPTSH
jgi:hypothetical protein